MNFELFLSIFAALTGPVVAVIIAQRIQVREKVRERQLHLLRALMSTRRTTLHPDRIMALNLIDIEFSGNPKVLSLFRDLIKIYNDADRWKNEDSDIRFRLLNDVDDASVRLIEAISKSLGYKYDNIEILRGGYCPSGLADQEEQLRIIREFFVELKEGKIALPVAVWDVRHPQKILEQAGETAAIIKAASHAEKKNDP